MHFIGKCPEFLKLTVDQRAEVMKQQELCFKCLGPRIFGDFTSAKRFNINSCGRKQHLALRIDEKPFHTHNQKVNNMQLGTKVTKTSKQARDSTENESTIKNHCSL